MPKANSSREQSDTMTDGGAMLRCALRYAKLGLRVVPCWWPAGTACACSQGRGCRSPAKHPLITRWQATATTDAAKIRSWWKRWPEANIGAVLGPRRLLLDADKAKDGLVTLARLEREHTPLPVEWSAVSGGGAVSARPDRRRVDIAAFWCAFGGGRKVSLDGTGG